MTDNPSSKSDNAKYDHRHAERTPACAHRTLNLGKIVVLFCSQHVHSDRPSTLSRNSVNAPGASPFLPIQG